MKITDLLKKESVLLEGHATDKKDALHTLVGLMAKQGNVADVETYEACVLKREEEGSTGVGEGVAIPHAKTSAVTRPDHSFISDCTIGGYDVMACFGRLDNWHWSF